jgi:DNA-directed RNA polymerase specialized sigma24 family protein
MPAVATTIDAEHLQRLAEKLARKVWHPGVAVDLEDLVQEGVVAGLKALPKFDPSRGVKLSTFLYRRIFGGILDTFRKPGATLVRTPRGVDRIMVVGETGDQPLAELAIDRGGVHILDAPAPPDSTGLSRLQRRLIHLLYRKRLPREQAAAKLKVNLEQLEDLEHETAIVLRRGTQEVQTITEELDMIALADRHASPATETVRTICNTCGNPCWRNHRCKTQTCENYNKGNGKKYSKKGKSKGMSVAVTHLPTPASTPAPTPAAPTVGPAEMAAMTAVVQTLLSLSESGRTIVLEWVGRTFRVSA